MAAEVVNSWDKRMLAASEATFGTTPDPAAGQVLEFVSIDPGPIEQGVIRPKKDRAVGRGMTTGYVKGRVEAIPWSVDVANKSRAAADTVPSEAALMKAAGLLQTVNASTSVVYTPSAAPIESGAFSPLSLYYRDGIGGSAPSAYKAEQLRGGVVRSITWSGGDRELMTKFSGACIGKYHLGFANSITLASGVATSLVFANAEEGYRFGRVGWYQCESEIVKVTAMNYATFTATLLRAQLASSGVAHTAQKLYPYFPAVSYAGAPLSEVSCAITVGGQTILFQSFEVSFTSGMDLGPGETGSAYIQTPLVKRYDCKVTLRGLMRREDMALVGKATEQATPVAVTIVCGTGAGGVVTFSLPYCELDAHKFDDDANGPQMQAISLRCRDNSGNDMLTVTYT
jgi:hypothetical protein